MNGQSILATVRRTSAYLEAAGMPSVMEGQSKEKKNQETKEERKKTKHNAGDIISF